MSGLLDWMLVAGCWIFFTETRFALWKNPDFEKRSKNLEAIRLPLRHEMGERAGGEVVLGEQGRSFIPIRKFILEIALS
jgi:hypothetical protein